MLHRVNRHPTCHALKLRTLMEWHRTSVLKNLHRQRFEFFLQVTSLDLQRRSSAIIVARTLTHAAIPHICGYNGVYICRRDLRVRSLLRASYWGPGR